MGKDRVPTYDKVWRVEESHRFGTDPTVELSAASIPDLDWNLNLLRTAGQYLDWISVHGYWGNTENGLVLRPQYFVFELYANLMKDTVLDLWKEDVPVLSGRVRDGDRTVDAVDIVVTADGGAYAVAAVNKDPEAAQTVSFCFLEDTPREMRVHTLNGPSVDAFNDVGRTEVGVDAGKGEPFAGSVTLAPHSVNVIELR